MFLMSLVFSFSSKIVFKNEREKAKRKEKKGNEYLRASDNNSLVHVLKQKAQSRRSEAHRIRSVQHHKAIVLIISVGNFIRNLYPVKKKLFDMFAELFGDSETLVSAVLFCYHHF